MFTNGVMIPAFTTHRCQTRVSAKRRLIAPKLWRVFPLTLFSRRRWCVLSKRHRYLRLRDLFCRYMRIRRLQGFQILVFTRWALQKLWRIEGRGTLFCVRVLTFTTVSSKVVWTLDKSKGKNDGGRKRSCPLRYTSSVYKTSLQFGQQRCRAAIGVRPLWSLIQAR